MLEAPENLANREAAARTHLRWADDAADEIVRYIDSEQVDMAVLGTHGHGMLERALLGSVSSAVARAAGCPVLLIPPDASSAKERDQEARVRSGK